MTKDAQGYNKETEYTCSFFDGWTESKIKLVSFMKNIEPPKIKTACELGFGQGLTLNILANATDTKWYGTDFHEKQAAFASQMARETTNSAKIYDLSFEEFAKIDELPRFDLIVLHGVISWISKKNQAIIFEFIKNNLNEGGLLYISYNAKPGMEAFRPARHLLFTIFKMLPEEFDTPQKKVQASLLWLEKLNKTNPEYLQVYPSIKKD